MLQQHDGALGSRALHVPAGVAPQGADFNLLDVDRQELTVASPVHGERLGDVD